MSQHTGATQQHSSRLVAVAICCATIVVDGYDLIVYGTVVPTLVDGSAEWTLSTAQAGRIGSYALIGMLIGALTIGTVTDIVGRRRIMLACIGWFSTAMLLAAVAPSPEIFGLTRFLAGLGLGGVVPTAIALTIEYAHPRHRSTTNAFMFIGYSIGGLIAALSAIWVIPTLGWRSMFVGGALLGFALMPVAWKFLPESASYLMVRGRRDEARALAARYDLAVEEPEDAGEGRGKLTGITELFKPRFVVGTVLFWIGTGMGLLLVYGLNTWLAQIMIEAGYELGSALAFLLVLNLGAIIGTPALGAVADRSARR